MARDTGTQPCFAAEGRGRRLPRERRRLRDRARRCVGVVRHVDPELAQVRCSVEVEDAREGRRARRQRERAEVRQPRSEDLDDRFAGARQRQSPRRREHAAGDERARVSLLEREREARDGVAREHRGVHDERRWLCAERVDEPTLVDPERVRDRAEVPVPRLARAGRRDARLVLGCSSIQPVGRRERALRAHDRGPRRIRRGDRVCVREPGRVVVATREHVTEAVVSAHATSERTSPMK